jgi:uncharacterized membrane protein (UPF0127 family)
MHRRFKGAATSELSCPGGTVRAVVARSFRLRFLGLMGLTAQEFEPLLFPRCRSIHMRGMRAPIDLVWLSVEGSRGVVVGVVERLALVRHSRAPRNGSPRKSFAALELAPGEAGRLGLRTGAAVTVR